ncbi:MAG TPA: ATP-binding protein, partial [Methanocorpusculum sp.]|nr:ATP-binding protein [Methanocorpusculum sp.]
MTTTDGRYLLHDNQVKENIARALWMREYDPDLIPPEILDRIGDQKNSCSAFGKRMRLRLADLLTTPESFNPDYTARYTTLVKYAEEITAHQAYAMINLLGLDSARGYQELPTDKKYIFPEDDRPQF